MSWEPEEPYLQIFLPHISHLMFLVIYLLSIYIAKFVAKAKSSWTNLWKINWEIFLQVNKTGLQ